jgi:hypothetical protein
MEAAYHRSAISADRRARIVNQGVVAGGILWAVTAASGLVQIAQHLNSSDAAEVSPRGGLEASPLPRPST